jgi:hypothetical protein
MKGEKGFRDGLIIFNQGRCLTKLTKSHSIIIRYKGSNLLKGV